MNKRSIIASENFPLRPFPIVQESGSYGTSLGFIYIRINVYIHLLIQI